MKYILTLTALLLAPLAALHAADCPSSVKPASHQAIRILGHPEKPPSFGTVQPEVFAITSPPLILPVSLTATRNLVRQLSWGCDRCWRFSDGYVCDRGLGARCIWGRVCCAS